LNHESYVLKTDLTDINNANIGLIKTDLNGESECANQVIMTPLLREVIIEEIEFTTRYLSDNSEQKTFPNLFTDMLDEDCNEIEIRSNETKDIASHQLTFNANVYPNLIGADLDKLTLEIENETEGYIDLKITNMQGQLIYNKNIYLNQGFHNLYLPTANLSTGVNILTLISEDNKVQSLKLVKQ